VKKWNPCLFLPPYCAELNKNETLWHHLKHLWFRIEDYQSKNRLEKSAKEILKNAKTQYTIIYREADM
jgi:transposase